MASSWYRLGRPREAKSTCELSVDKHGHGFAGRNQHALRRARRGRHDGRHDGGRAIGEDNDVGTCGGRHRHQGDEREEDANVARGHMSLFYCTLAGQVVPEWTRHKLTSSTLDLRQKFLQFLHGVEIAFAAGVGEDGLQVVEHPG